VRWRPAPRRRPPAAAVLSLGAVLLAGCGGGGERLTVSAAASLKAPFTAYGRVADARFQFGGSDELAAQIRLGARPEVYAAANTELAERLHGEGLVERPVVFAANRLVLAVPAGPGARVGSLRDLQADGVTIAAGSESVPIGGYTRAVLSRLPERESSAILRNVRSEEPDVGGIVGKLAQGAVDAGFVYRTDVEGAGGRLRAIELPDSLRPTVAYAAAVVKGAERPEAARAFVDGLLDGAGRRALEQAGFAPPPAQ
jgi:molybdate transport system substrate-binding protein